MGIDAESNVVSLRPRHAPSAPFRKLAAPRVPTKIERDAVAFGPVRVSRLRQEEFAAIVEDALASDGAALGVAFCNAHTAEIALRDARLAAALGRFVVVNDGIGMELGARIVSGRGFPENLNGTDFVPYLLGRLSRPTRVYLLGGRPGVAQEAAGNFSAHFPNVVVVGCRDGGFSAAEEAAVVAAVRAAAPDILLVAMGNPRQEIFIADHLETIGARVMFGVGALFDFVAGRVPRAPEPLRRMRLEWAYRLWLEPRRLARRYTTEFAAFLAAALRLRLAGAQRRGG